MRKIKDVTKKLLFGKHEGLNGIVVTIGLCIVALLLCVGLNTGLGGYVTNIISAMTTKSTTLLGS